VLGLNRWTHSVSLLGTASLGHHCLRHAVGLAMKAPTLGQSKGKVVGLTLLSLSPNLRLALMAPMLGPTVAALFLGLEALALSLGRRVTILDSFTNLEDHAFAWACGVRC
jgi:hypothetical protein